ncbi:MAG: glycosyltransferase family 4 protein [Candidatus Sedimenticola sp. 6PFRAG7]
MLGFRGFPGVQGGVETHVEHICPILASHGCRVTVAMRAPYVPEGLASKWRGVRIIKLWSPHSRGLEAILHTFIGILYAGFLRPDVVHLQAIGPALMTPIARLLGLRVVVTHHGPDYDRQKWGPFAKFVLQMGERFGMRWSQARIVISKTIANMVFHKHGKEADLIPNGVVLPELDDAQETLDDYDLEPGKYVLIVSRLVPEKRHDDLIEAFAGAGLEGYKLVIVGSSDHPDDYSRRIERMGNEIPGVVMTGFQSGEALRQLFSNAGLFVLPSSHEGLPIALLEALSYGLPVVASDIPANLEVELPEHRYFPLGDIEQLRNRIVEALGVEWTMKDRESTREEVSAKYDWQEISRKTLEVYRRVVNRKHN